MAEGSCQPSHPRILISLRFLPEETLDAWISKWKKKKKKKKKKKDAGQTADTHALMCMFGLFLGRLFTIDAKYTYIKIS